MYNHDLEYCCIFKMQRMWPEAYVYICLNIIYFITLMLNYIDLSSIHYTLNYHWLNQTG